MDLKDVVQRVRDSATEAELAFRAGHPDVAERYLMDQMVDIRKYFDEKTSPAGDVTESATSEKPEETSTEKPEQVPGAVLPAKQFVSPDADQKKALEQAGP